MIFYILAAVAILQGIISLRDGLRAVRHIRTFRPRSARSERVQIFCPCKGLHPEFEKNISSILNQDYPHFQVRFIVDSVADPAYAALLQLGVRDIVVAGRASDCGQKVHNLSRAVAAAPTTDVYVFCDSDARFDRQWLSRLVAPLDEMIITTGYRWYVANRFHIPTLLRSAWNASVVTMLGNHDRNFAWGGSMAMRRSTFEKLRILDAWRGSVSDDYSVTRAAERGGGRIVFVPECLTPSYGECTWRELLDFTTRQITITRIYHPRLWRVGFVGQVISSAALIILPFTVPALWFAVYVLSAAKSGVRWRAVGTILGPPALSNFGWFYILFSPFIALLYLYNMIRSAFSTDIVWRHIHYKLVSPNKTLVLGEFGAGES